MSSPFDSRLTKILGLSITPLLKAEGFSKNRKCYHRKHETLTWVIELQKSRWNDQQQMQFTLNCGIYIPGVISTYINRSEPKNPEIPFCCITVRVGMLQQDHLDKWWTLSVDQDEATDQLIEQELHLAVTNNLLPFLSKFKGMDDVLSYLEKPRPESERYVSPIDEVQSRIYLAILYWLKGNQQNSQENLQAAEQAAVGKPIEEAVINLRARIG